MICAEDDEARHKDTVSPDRQKRNVQEKESSKIYEEVGPLRVPSYLIAWIDTLETGLPSQNICSHPSCRAIWDYL